MPGRRRALLLAALGFARLELQPVPPPLAALKGWLGSWRGIGAIAEGMHRQGFDISITQHDERGWRAINRPAGGLLRWRTRWKR